MNGSVTPVLDCDPDEVEHQLNLASQHSPLVQKPAVKSKDYASALPTSGSPPSLDLDRLLQSYGVASTPASQITAAATSKVQSVLLGSLLELIGPAPALSISAQTTSPKEIDGKRESQAHRHDLLTPPTSDDGAELIANGPLDELAGPKVARGDLSKSDAVHVELSLGGRAATSSTCAGDSEGDVSLVDFSGVYDYLASIRTSCLTRSRKRATFALGLSTGGSADCRVPPTSDQTAVRPEAPDDPLPAEFRELGASARTAYYANSPFLRATRDGSVRRPRGQVLPSALDMDVTPLKTMLPLEAYYSPPRSRIMSSVDRLAVSLPSIFPHDAEHLAKYLDDPELALGDKLGRVEWSDGIGKMVRDDSRANTVGYTGGVGSDKKGGVHLFLDHSNIFLSYLATLAEVKVDGIPSHARKTLSIPILTMLMARGRPIKSGRMHLVGSYPMMQDLDPAVKLGWRCTVMKRVPVDEDTELAQVAAKANRYSKKGGTTSESEAGATTDPDVLCRKFKEPAVQVRKNREQGVDEMLQLKLLQTIVKNSHGTHHQGTIVLATGDGHGGQYNLDGFVGCVRDALRHGWAVELWAWNSGLSRAWEREKLNNEGNFVLWNLDHWLADLVELK